MPLEAVVGAWVINDTDVRIVFFYVKYMIEHTNSSVVLTLACSLCSSNPGMENKEFFNEYF